MIRPNTIFGLTKEEIKKHDFYDWRDIDRQREDKTSVWVHTDVWTSKECDDFYGKADEQYIAERDADPCPEMPYDIRTELYDKYMMAYGNYDEKVSRDRERIQNISMALFAFLFVFIIIYSREHPEESLRYYFAMLCLLFPMTGFFGGYFIKDDRPPKAKAYLKECRDWRTREKKRRKALEKRNKERDERLRNERTEKLRAELYD